MIEIGYVANSKECWLRTGVYFYTVEFIFFNLVFSFIKNNGVDFFLLEVCWTIIAAFII